MMGGKLEVSRKTQQRCKMQYCRRDVNSKSRNCGIVGTTLLTTASEKQGPLLTQCPDARETHAVGRPDIHAWGAANWGFCAEQNGERIIMTVWRRKVNSNLSHP